MWSIDTTPVPVQFSPPSSPGPSDEKLLLPAHVSVLGSVPVEILPPDTEQDYIEYLDYGGRDELPTLRYFETPEEFKQPTVLVCKRCGAKGDHIAKDCPVIICLTCGVRNEHSTLSCPISKVCFSCGMKGHINSSCPNRGRLANTYDDCERCGSTIHTAHECPTLWRLYDYLSETERNNTLEFRKEKRSLDLGNGGEGYIAQDIWCYNCGESGHWGDDCTVAQHCHDMPKEYSAFSEHNTTTGPFADVTMEPSQRNKQDWEQDDPMFQSWGTRVPTNVGKRGKAKEMMRLGAQQRRDDDDDFFARMNKSNSKQPPVGPKKTNNPAQPKKMSISFRPDSSVPSLLDRMSDGPSRHNDRDRHRNRDRDRDWDRDKRRDRDRDRDRDRGHRRREDTGPRYHGGYS